MEKRDKASASYSDTFKLVVFLEHVPKYMYRPPFCIFYKSKATSKTAKNRQ